MNVYRVKDTQAARMLVLKLHRKDTPSPEVP